MRPSAERFVVDYLEDRRLLTGPQVFGVVPMANSHDAVAEGAISITFDQTVEIALDATADRQLTSISISSSDCIFTGDPPINVGILGGSSCNIFKAAFGGSFGSLSFGNVAQIGLSSDFIVNDLSVVGSLVGGGHLGEGDLVYLAPDYSDVDFSGQNLVDSDFSGAILVDADFRGANLAGATFHNATLRGADFTDAIVQGANFRNTSDHGFTAQQLYSTRSYQQADLIGINLSQNDLRGWNFEGKDLTHAALSRSDLSTLLEVLNGEAHFTIANFTDANLTGANLTKSDLGNADFTRATVADAKFAGSHNLTNKQFYGTSSYERQSLSGIDLSLLDLTGWNFSSQFLVNASFQDATMAGADFSRAIVNGVAFRGTTAKGFVADQLYGTASYLRSDLSGIDLGGNDLSSWSFAEKNLSGVMLDHTNLSGVDFAGAALARADLTEAVISGANFDSTRGFTSEQLYSTASYQTNQLAETGRFVIAPGGILQVVLDGGTWDSTITVPDSDVATPRLDGILRVDFDSSLSLPEQARLSGSTYDLFNWSEPIDGANRFDQIEMPARTEWDLSRLYETGQIVLISSTAQPGDANFDFRFDQLDLVQVLIHRKYRTGEPATWEQGDWNGDGVFDQSDAVAALQTGNYLQGPYASLVVGDVFASTGA